MRFTTILLAVSLLAADGPGRAPATTLEAALAPQAARLGLEGRVAELAAGRAVSWELDSENGAEVAGAGAVLIDAPVDELVAGFRDLDILRRRGVVIASGRFPEEARPSDMRGLEVPATTLEALRRAKTRSSDVKLSGREIAAVRRARAGERADVFKRSVVDRVRAFRDRGLSGLEKYEDKKRPVDLAKTVDELVAGVAKSRPPGALPVDERFQYWSLERFGSLKPVVGAADMTVMRGRGAARIETVQFYASHYFDGFVTAIDFVEVASERGPATLIRITFRARLDLFTGLLGGLKRKLGRSRTVKELAENLERLRAAYARPAAGGPAE